MELKANQKKALSDVLFILWAGMKVQIRELFCLMQLHLLKIKMLTYYFVIPQEDFIIRRILWKNLKN